MQMHNDDRMLLRWKAGGSIEIVAINGVVQKPFTTSDNLHETSWAAFKAVVLCNETRKQDPNEEMELAADQAKAIAVQDSSTVSEKAN